MGDPDDPRFDELRKAVNVSCTCGGKGPNDDGVCPACMVWHEMVTFKDAWRIVFTKEDRP